MGLSKAEKEFLEGQSTPTPEYRRVLVHRIKKKREELLEDLQLIDAFLAKEEK